jgi:glutamate-1-semialdehyde aminotransferase/spore coat polysaccharide biosynthesis protein SpsF (cytidylyltransferase family)
MEQKIKAIVQARLTSSRFPKKILGKIGKFEGILYLLKNLKKAETIDDIIVVIPSNKKNDYLNNFLIAKGIKVFRGSEKNVLKRYYECARKFKVKNILRITSDCPLLDFKLIDKMSKNFINGNFDYYSNTIHRTFPDGLDLEFFKFNTLKKAYENVILSSDKEHVTSYVKRTPIFKKNNYYYKKDYSKLRVTLDYKSDLVLINQIIKNHNKKKSLHLEDIIGFYKNHKKLFEINEEKIKKYQIHNKKNLPILKWKEANDYIMGGNSLFSKRPDIYLDERWPAYFLKAKGCYIKAIDGKKYQDVSNMGVGTNILGYANSRVDKAVKKRISEGNMSTLNSIEEVKLAKKLVKLHPWSSKVKFTRSGGEANTVAVRLARAKTNKQKIAICGYHGWHDWYLASNLSNSKNLNLHLLPGLEISGVYKGLKNSVYTFEYNNFRSLKKLIDNNNQIGIIKMEVTRNFQPKKEFLKKIRELADKKKLILIFDECTSGFRENLGGIHLKYKVDPDILILGKALGNGYAINAILGKKEIMNTSNDTFISSTFWSEASGYTAALKTLELMSKNKSWEYISSLGKYIKSKWSNLAKKFNLDITIKGLSSLPSFNFKNNHLVYKSFITQEMLKMNILANDTIYVSISHSKKNLKSYFQNLEKIFSIISKCENDNDDIFRYFDSKLARTTFRRLN